MRRMEGDGVNGVARAFWAEIRQGLTPDEALLHEVTRRGGRNHRLVRTVGRRIERH
jgi:hypothetical protein